MLVSVRNQHLVDVPVRYSINYVAFTHLYSSVLKWSLHTITGSANRTCNFIVFK